MNKKFTTLMAAALLATSVDGWAQVYMKGSSTGAAAYEADGTTPAVGYTTSTKYKALKDGTGEFDFFTVDQASWKNSGDFPKVSPFVINAANGAKAISSLEKVDGKSDSRYFQLVVGDATDPVGGKEVLTMVWVKDGANGTSGHYEVNVENVGNANVDLNPIYLDRTLWEVRAMKDAAGTVIYYTLINKASQMALQIDPSGVTPRASATNTYKEASLKVQNGQTNWRWADGQMNADGKALRNSLRAQFSTTETVYLMKKKNVGKGDIITLSALVANSNDVAPLSTVTMDGASETNQDVFTPIVFEAWEANPIVLTAAQINSELGNENITTEYQGSRDGFKFFFEPNVSGEGAVNVMIGSEFTAIKPKSNGGDRLPGDTPDGFVSFQKKGTKEYLTVDTAYHFNGVGDRYDLKMAVRGITYPGYAVAEDGATLNGEGKFVKEGTAYTEKELYEANTGTGDNTLKSYTQLKRQANFRAILYPSTQSVRLQAEMMYKADKAQLAAGNPWWKQMGADLTGNYLKISEFAADPTINPYAVAAGKVNAVGYYPAYTQKNTAGVIDQDNRVLSYKTAYAAGSNGYKQWGEQGTADQDTWNAVGSLWSSVSSTPADASTVVAASSATAEDMLVQDPASLVATATAALANSMHFALAHNNVTKLVALTNTHKELTTDLFDVNDTQYNGLLTFITLNDLKGNTDDLANIPTGYYYIKNANKVNTDLLRNGDYRVEDLAGTNATYSYWNSLTKKWTVGSGDGALNQGENPNTHRTAERGNVAYVADKIEIPSAQWYISGNGGYYNLINRESSRTWGTSYWWKVPGEDNVYVNMSAYTDGSGLTGSHRDTIAIEPVAASVLANRELGYLNISQAEALEDTSSISIKFNTVGDLEMYLGQGAGADSVLTVLKEAQGAYKLERVKYTNVDLYDEKVHAIDTMIYGINPAAKAENPLVRALYYIYKDEVSSNSGAETTGIRTREYVTLDGGKYRFTKVTVKVDPETGYTTSTDAEVIAGTKADVRKPFFVKEIAAGNKFVLVDPDRMYNVTDNMGTKTYHGARAFVNQLTGEIQAAGLKSTAVANAFDNSILTIDKAQAYNYADVRTEGAVRDTVEFFKATDPSYVLCEEGANVGLLASVDALRGKNTAMFLDTANVSKPEFMRFLIGLRNTDLVETSNIPGHNKHISTTADYLVNLIDSVATNPAYEYKNIDKNTTPYYRLGFITGTHKGSELKMAKDSKVFDLSKDGLNYATFAFRYADTDRNNFYIETMYNADKKGWLKTINHVLVVTPSIQEAEVFQLKKSAEAPTSNDNINATTVSVIGGKGVVTVKNAAGKKVVVADILGRVIANTVLTSDNVTIATSAGIITVAVEGEAAAKIVVE